MPHNANQPGTARLYLLYHELRREPASYSYVTDLGRFEEQCALFAERHAQPGAGPIPEITFDDGHRSDHELALPILDRYGLRAHFFITAGWTGTRERYMDWAEVKQLHRSGHLVGAHGWSHRLFTQCSAAELQQELEKPRELLEDRLGVPIHTLSLPGGRSNRRVLEACRAAGYTQVYTSQPRLEPNPDAPILGRLNLRGDATLKWLSDLLSPESRVLHRIMRQDRLKQAGKSLLGDGLYARLWRVLNRAEPVPDGLDASAEAELP